MDKKKKYRPYIFSPISFNVASESLEGEAFLNATSFYRKKYNLKSNSDAVKHCMLNNNEFSILYNNFVKQAKEEQLQQQEYGNKGAIINHSE